MAIEGELKNSEHLCYLEDLESALKEINIAYFGWVNHNSSKPQQTYSERVFSYELYHQIRKLMGNDEHRSHYLSGEISKEVSIREIVKNHKIIPDLVLHKDLGKIISGGQLYLAEIKMAQNKKTLDDLAKLTELMNSGLDFYFYIFIIVGKNRYELKSSLKRSRRKNSFNNYIVCVCVKEENGVINIDMMYLKDILN